MARVDIETMIGQKYGEWTVLKIEWIERKNSRKRILECRCSCGNIRKLEKCELLSGRRKSCGCKLLKTEDLTGKEIGEWKVIKYLKHGRWLCECSCGNVRKVSGQQLRNGRSKSCGCMKGNYISDSKLIDITGFKTGKITVLKRSDDIEREKELGTSLWVCQCECGNIKEISKTAIIYHGQKTCGECERGGFIDIDGMKFGRWTVIGRDINRNDGVFWKVKCECGNLSSLKSSDLRSGHSRSCGCIKFRGVSALRSYLRFNILEWKKLSMENCDYSCVITGGKFDIIHHVYPFHKIIDETLDSLGLEIKENTGMYSEQELKNIVERFRELHFKHGLGVCLRKDIHDKFHHLYGSKYFTENDFYQFYYEMTGKKFNINNFKEAI